MPRKKPKSTGIILANVPSLLCSKAGCNNDQKQAAVITPEAKPSIIFCTLLLILSRSRNTVAAPNVVPMKGVANPMIIFSMIV